MTNEFDLIASKDIEYASEVKTNSFDAVLTQDALNLESKPERIICHTRPGTTEVLELVNENSFHEVIFQAFYTGLKSDWFDNLGDYTKIRYIEEVRDFISWLNESTYESASANRYKCLNDYQAHQLNEQGKKQSSLGTLKKIIEHGLSSPFLTNKCTNYLLKLLDLTISIKSTRGKGVNLTDWFALPWLRSVMIEKDYLQLESSSRLFLSFRITIAVTLLYLLEGRNQWKKHTTKVFDTSNDTWAYTWNRLLLNELGQFDEQGEAKDTLTRLLWQDLVKPSSQNIVQRELTESGSAKLKRDYKIEGKTLWPWQSPVMFHPDFQAQYSPIEEMLLALLAACETVQPTDIPKLKSSDYAIERKTSGRLIMMECIYYKGRAGDYRQPAILMASDIWTQALDQYISGLPKSSLLFKSNVISGIKLPGLGKNANNHTLTNFLLKLWKIPELKKNIHSELKRKESSPLFLKTMFALEQGSESYRLLSDRIGISAEEYRTTVPRPLPTNLFSLTHIKNTAVYAGSDNYRESDLINHHSHTSATEKHDYLTDENKDFVNRLGRITRLVLHDLQNVIYQPSVDVMQLAVNDIEIRTRLVEATEVNDVTLRSLQQTIDQGDNDDDIIIADTLDSALYFIHYIDQAELMLPKLLAVRPDFVERTLLIQVEWMTRTLSRMGQTKTAKSQYNSLREHLPPLFNHLLESIE